MGQGYTTSRLGAEGARAGHRIVNQTHAVRTDTHQKTAFVRFGAGILVLTALILVHSVSLAEGVAAETKPGGSATVAPKERVFRGAVPPNVEDMREQILAAVSSGEIAELKGAIEWNEMRPDFGIARDVDPIAHWRAASAGGDGREILAMLANMLALPPARLALGRDPENSLVYVWPYLAELPLDSLSPSELVDLYRLMPASEAQAMIKAKKWTWWRLAIGADGTWHTFRSYR